MAWLDVFFSAEFDFQFAFVGVFFFLFVFCPSAGKLVHFNAKDQPGIVTFTKRRGVGAVGERKEDTLCG